jgi:subtilisin family serine protease
MVDAGLVVVASAGNDNQDACQFFPRHPDMMKAGAMEIVGAVERRRSVSNFGPCVDAYAPGTALRGPSPASDTAVTDPRNGTSFASPHLAGIAARILDDQPTLTSAQVKAIVVSTATVGALDPASLPAGTANRLTYIDPDD